MSKLEAILKQFQKTVERLENVLQQEKNEFIRDAAIQRYEFTFDLSWKLIKACLEKKAAHFVHPPRDVSGRLIIRG